MSYMSALFLLFLLQCQILNDKLQDAQLFMEFERIPKRREHAKYDCALLEENEAKNHDPNFLPYDDNRVRLTPSMDNRHGYVNASYISVGYQRFSPTLLVV